MGLFLLTLLLGACAGNGDTPRQSDGQGQIESPLLAEADLDNEWRISVVEGSGAEVCSFTEKELVAAIASLDSLPQGAPGRFAHAYSTINNWPTSRFYAADGYDAASVLALAGLYDTAQTITFRGVDGYEISLTREQIFSPQYNYPHAGEDGDGAEPVFALIAWRWREGSDDMASIRADKPCFIIGQSNPFEHTNSAFVESVSEIIVSDAPCEQWLAATIFPMPGAIAAGEKVKLQHPDFGLVKIHYTLDGNEPTPLSPMYNPSTYQPELNVPIPVNETTVIKAIVCGYGKSDSEIAEFMFTIAE
ncbi:MAG: chitobiase/beta-hexosaminidase C-terminal domain-containing protein [Peptococcaceae bacterium]|nr:chitobiase/beta-hexosaminidase C-terminal domain-containing protein [Peptococcaceae bacterium]